MPRRRPPRAWRRRCRPAGRPWRRPLRTRAATEPISARWPSGWIQREPVGARRLPGAQPLVEGAGRAVRRQDVDLEEADALLAEALGDPFHQRLADPALS